MADVLNSVDTDHVYAAFPDTADEPASRTLECVDVRVETPTIKTFCLRDTHSNGAQRFTAGQAMLLTLMIDGKRFDRTFSIASSPAKPGILQLTIKVNPAGTVSRWLHDNFVPGMTLTARYPIGRFTLDNAPRSPLALVSGGSGASPLMGMLRTLAAHVPDANVAWVHAARNNDEIVFGEELTVLQSKMPNLRVTVWVTDPTPGWFGLSGIISRGALWAVVPDFGRRTVYCCGPAGFMDHVKKIHAAEGARNSEFHIEHFGPVASPAPESDVDGAAPSDESETRSFQIRLEGREFVAKENETILAAATRQQVVIPCGCASGMCGTCRVKHVSGEITMQHAGGLSTAEEAAGWILACSSRPNGDVEITF